MPLNDLECWCRQVELDERCPRPAGRSQRWTASRFVPPDAVNLSDESPTPVVLGAEDWEVGGGGGNRTRVREHSAFGSTCLATSFHLTESSPDGQGYETASLLGFDGVERGNRSRELV